MRSPKAAKEATYVPPPSHEKFETITAGTFAIEDLVRDAGYRINCSGLDEGAWGFPNVAAQKVMDKLRTQGTPLGEVAKSQICMGIKSGLTEAFVIDGAQRKSLVKKSKSAEELIFPFLDGRDVRRY